MAPPLEPAAVDIDQGGLDMLTAAPDVDIAAVVAALDDTGSADVTLPVGTGRRRFLGQLLDVAGDSGISDQLVLVVGMSDLQELWQRDLTAALAPRRVGLYGAGAADDLTSVDVVVTSGPDAVRALSTCRPRPLVVLDEPDVIAARSPDVSPRIEEFPQVRLWLRADLSSGRGATRATDQPLSPWDRDVGKLVAGLIDGELERRVPTTFIRWSAMLLGTSAADLRRVGYQLDDAQLDIVAYLVGKSLDAGADLGAADGSQGVQWRALELPDGPVLVPSSLRAHFPAGSLLDPPCTLMIDPHDGFSLVDIVTPARLPGLIGRRSLLDALGGHRVRDHPFVGHTLEVSVANQRLAIRAVPPPTDTRVDLVLPNEIWEEIDRNLHGLFRNRDLLAGLGLGLNRGVLLHGPPGTGKTQLVRTIIAELHGQATALLLSADVMRSELAQAYRLAEQLAPSIVVLEDADLVIGDRSTSDHSALVAFLTSVDGVMTDKAGVLTLATTNEVAALDAAAIRSARFDRIIEVPNPPPVGRRRIWQRYLTGLHGPFDLDLLVRLTEGSSGADIRELVRHAILDTDGVVTTDVLAEHARARLAPPDRHGQYL